MFHLKPQPNAIVIDVVGGVGLQLRQGVGPKYIPYKMTSKVIDWKEFWFYVENQAPTLPPPDLLERPFQKLVGILGEGTLTKLTIFSRR